MKILAANVFPQSLSSFAEQEAYLQFSYKGAVNSYITAIVRDDHYYLPVTDLLSQLSINFELDIQDMSVSGYFLETDNKYRIGFQDYLAIVGKDYVHFTSDDVLIREVDFYMQPWLFEELFNMKFTVDTYYLTLKLESPYTLPVIAQLERAQTRTMQYFQGKIISENYELIAPRNPRFWNAGFLDYSTFTRISSTGSAQTYNLRFGGELFMGDIQGQLSGTHTTGSANYEVSDIRWRYAILNNKWLSSVKLGQIRSTGLHSENFLGLQISNEPVDPPKLYDTYTLDGITTPESEVELYRNNQMIGYVKSDAQGYYRFNIPVTYGSTDLTLKMYGPNGGITKINRHVETPYSFTPRNRLYYQIAAGSSVENSFGQNNPGFFTETNTSYGFSNWLTGRFGTEYQSFSDSVSYTPYASFTSRIAMQYLFNLDIVPGRYYQMQSQATYQSSGGWSIKYINYDRGTHKAQLSKLHEISGQAYVPFTVLGKDFYGRFAGNYQWFRSKTELEYQATLRTNINRAILQINYENQHTAGREQNRFLNGIISATSIYALPRSRIIPSIFHGIYTKTKAEFNFQTNTLNHIGLQVSSKVWQNGRVCFTAEHNIPGQFTTLKFSFTYDFPAARSVSSANYSSFSTEITQSLRGSIGYDRNHQTFLFNNRQQVGRAAASVRMFVDNDNSGEYTDGEEIIPDKAIRIKTTSTKITESNGILRLSQLQPYRHYNLEIDMTRIRNPVLVPATKNFSIIPDPNSYKQIDIPFYMSGVIDGKVVRKLENTQQPVAGIRLYLVDQNGENVQTLRTFSDGSFYAMEIPPGEYSLIIDSSQLEFLQSTVTPSEHSVIVEPVAKGDYVTDLNFLLIPDISSVAENSDTGN